MADPGAQPIMGFWIKASDLGADLLDPFQVFARDSLIDILTWRRRDHPYRAPKQKRIGEINPAVFFTCHGVSGKEAPPDTLTENFACPSHDFRFGAAYVGKQRARGQATAQQFNQIDDATDGRRQYHHLAPPHRVDRIGGAFVDCSLGACSLESRRAITAHNSPAESMLFKSQSQRTADQSCANDRDVPNRHENPASRINIA